MTPEAAETARWVADRFALGTVCSMEWVARGATGEVHRLVTDTGPYAVKRAFWREDPDGVVESEPARGQFVERCRAEGVVPLDLSSPLTARDRPRRRRDRLAVHAFAGVSCRTVPTSPRSSG